MPSEIGYVVARLEALERELRALRQLLTEQDRRSIKLEGLWKGVEISEGDLEQAKRSLFKEAYGFEAE